MTDTPHNPLEEIETLRKRLQDLEILAGISSPENKLPGDEGRARMYLDLAGVFMVVIEADQTVSLINRKGCEILGWPEGEIIGRNWFDSFIPDRLRSDVQRVFKQLIAGEIEPVEFYKNPIVDRQGNERLIAWHNTVLRNRTGGITGTLSSGTDVTEQVRAEEKIRQLNCLLKTISDINQLIVRERDRKRLLEETCRIIVDRGGFRMAWVGEADYQTGRVRPLAQAGFDHGYLDSVEIRLDDHPRGRGPVGGAIRTGTPVVCQDTEADETFILWREAAREQGYRALAAFPLKLPNRILGSLNIYAGELGLFNEDMVRLLEELAEDLSFALQALEEREARRSAEQALRDSEGRFRDLYDNAPDMYLSVAAETGRVIDCNRTLSAVTGFSREEFIGRHVFDLYHPDCLDRVRKNLQQFLSTGEVQDEGLKILCRDGRTIEVSLKTSAVRDDAGRIRSSRSIWRDVSRQKEAERILENREAKIRSIFRAAPVGIGLVSYPERLLLEVNDLLCRMVGYTPEELIGQSARMLYPTDEDFQAVRRDKYAQIEDHGTGTVETRWRRKDGAVIDVLLSSTPLEPENYSAGVTFTALDITGRKRAEKALQTLAQKWQTTFDAMNDSIFLLDEQSRVVQCNRAMTELLQQPAEEIIGRPCYELLHQTAAPIEDCPSVRAFQTGRRETLSWQIGDRWFDVTADPIFDSGGRIIGAVHVLADITENRKAAEALQRNERLYRLMAENVTDVVWVLDLETLRFRYVSPSVERLRGYTPQEVIAQPLAEVLTPSSLIRLNTRLAELPPRSNKAAMETFVFVDEMEQPCRDGSTVWTEVTSRLLSNAETGHLEILGVSRDITARKKADQALKDREAHLSTLIDSSMDAILTLDTERVITEVNQAFVNQFGYSREEARGLSMAVFHPDDRSFSEFGRKVYPRIRAEGHWQGAWRYRRRDGTLVSMETIISALYQADGSIGGYVSVMRDITERLKAEEQKTALEQQLRQAQKLEAIGTLAGGIAHDFNNILGAVIGFTELARMDTPEGRPARDDLDQVLKAGLRAKDLVRQILTFSRKGTEALAPINIVPIVKEALKMLRASLPSTIEIKKQLPQAGAVVNSNPTQIHQILMNLCTNAAQAMGEGGGLLEVSLNEIVPQPEDLPPDASAVSGPYLELTVRDNGPGIGPDILEHIFEPYFTTKEKGLGTGLGLPVVHGIVQQHGGWIRVQSEPGAGAGFRVFLPLLQDVPATPLPADQTLLRGREHILAVDDEEMLIAILQKTLQHLGYRVTATTDPQQARAWFEKTPDAFDLVITDMTMPKLTGDRLVEEILRLRPECPVIICTGYSDQLSETRVREIGAQALLMKPIEIRVLALKIREVLDKG